MRFADFETNVLGIPGYTYSNGVVRGEHVVILCRGSEKFQNHSKPDGIDFPCWKTPLVKRRFGVERFFSQKIPNTGGIVLAIKK